MRNSIYRITLDMHDVASQVQITAKQHDTARKLHITLSENGSPYTIEEGCRAVLTINRTGSTVINDDCEIKLNGSVIMYDFNSQTTEVLGINECEVKLYDPDGDIITSPRFTLLVDENVYNDGEDHGIDHRNVLNRDKEDQHPIKAITGLEKELESKANAEKIYAEIALDRSRIDNIAALGQNSVIEVQKKYNTTGATTPLTFSLNNDGKCVVIIYYYKSAPNTETYSSSVLVNSQSIFTKTLDGAAGTYLEEVEFDGKAGDIVTITRDNVNVSINSVLYVTNKSTDTELADIRLGADGTIYPCAGDAVREQVSALKNDVDSQVGALKSDIDDLESEIFEPTNGILQNNVRLNKLARTETVLNLFNKATSVDGYALSESGQPYTNSKYTVSDFILLPSKSKVYVYYFDGTTVKPNIDVYICFYTYNKEMTGTRIISNYVTDVPIGAKYIRIAPSIQRKDSVMLFSNDEPCAPSEYVQYMDGVNNKFAFEDKIAEMEETLSGFTPIVKEVADNLNLASFEKGTAISKNATYNTYYIKTNGALSSVGEQYTNYNVFEYRLEANKKYVLSGRVALNGDLPLFGVKDTSGTSGKVTILKSIGKNYEDVYIEYTAEKDEYLFVAVYSSRGELIVYNAIVSYDYNDVVRARSIQSITNPWYGKKVVWLGTSVPAGQYADTSYAYEVAKYLGINLVNTSIPGLSIHLNENGEPRLSPYAGSSSATIAEYEAVGVTIPTSKTASGYYKSYEHIFEEENADADLYVFDVAPNNGNFDMSDWDAFNKNTWAYNDGTPFSEHRKTFLGALLFLMDKMYTLNPKARMVFVLGSSFAYTNGKEAFETVSAQWNIPIINVWEKINTSPKSLPIIKSKDGTDNHPSTYAHQCMGKMLIGEFLKIG